VRILQGFDQRLGRIAVTLGSFDGVHVGHQRLLARLVATTPGAPCSRSTRTPERS
jgi:FAD synthase